MWKYCSRISKLSFLFFFIYYFSFLSFFLSSIHFFFFLLIFLHHTRIPIYPYPLPFFSFTFHFPEPSSLFLSPALFLNFFFFFCLIPTHYPTFSVIRNEERTDGLDGSVSPRLPLRSLCRHTFRSAAAARLPPYRCVSSSPPPGWVRSACSFFLSFFLLFFRSCLFWFNFILRIGFCFVFCIWIMWETERMREKKIQRREKELI